MIEYRELNLEESFRLILSLKDLILELEENLENESEPILRSKLRLQLSQVKELVQPFF